MGVEFRILGPLEVLVDGVAMPVGGPRQRALLAMLLLSANRVVSRDRLIDELLDGASTENADRMLRVQVSRLRRVLEAADGDRPRVVGRAPGYVLRVEPSELDLDAFQERLAEGHRALEEQEYERASGVLRGAEALWRGRPLADLEFERFARLDIERLEELRLVACEDRIAAELALGRHAMLVPELETLVADHPLRERLRGQLMLALYRSGRQADALETYRTGHALLSEELALEPGPALRELEGSILRHEAVLELPPRHAEAPVRTEIAPAPSSHEPSPNGHRGLGRPVLPRDRRMLAGVAALGAALAAVVIVVLAWSGSRPLTATANSVAMLDPGALAIHAVINVGGQPGGIAAGAGAIWETDTADDRLIEIDPSTDGVQRIPVGRGPTGVAVGGGEVWVVNQLDRTVSEINPRALRIVNSFSVGNGAGAVAFGDGALWVANTTDDTISRIDPSGGAEQIIPLSGRPAGIAIGPEGVWVTSNSAGQLILIDPATNHVTQAEEIGNSPAGVAVGAGSVWVANTTEGSVSRFDSATGVVTNVNVGDAPVGVAYGDGAIWVANSLDGTVSRIDPRSGSTRRVHVGGAPTYLALSGKRLWAAVLPGVTAHLGGTLTVAEAGVFAGIGDSLDPAQFAGVSQWQMLSMTNDGLVTYRRVGGLAGSTLVPDLATSLPAPTDGGRTYTFRLRPGIHYSTGALVKPEDLRHELERVFALGNGYPQSFYTGIVGAQHCLGHLDLNGLRPAGSRCDLSKGIVADDATNTLTFHLTGPDPDFLYKLAFPWASAVPADTPDRPLGRSMPPATGPYMTKSITVSRAVGPGGHQLAFRTWTLIRNPRFHEWSAVAQPAGYPDRIVLTQGGNQQQAVDAVEQGRLDVLLPAPADRLTDLATHYTTQFHSEPLGATFALAMNTRLAPFDHLAVRQALNYALDRNRVVGFAGGPLAAEATCQILPPNLSGYQPYCPYTLGSGLSGSWQAPDLAKAHQLVNASGTRGMKVTLLVHPADVTNPTNSIGHYVVSLLDQLGYRASLRVTPHLYPTLDDSRSGTQIGWFTYEQDYPGPADFITVLLSCRSFVPASSNNLNDAEFCSPRIDQEIQRASALEASDPGAASETWAAIDRQITEQAPWVPLYNPRLDIATAPRLENFQYHPFFALLLDQLWVR